MTKKELNNLSKDDKVFRRINGVLCYFNGCKQGHYLTLNYSFSENKLVERSYSEKDFLMRFVSNESQCEIII